MANERIMVVEDEWVIADDIQRSLRNLGYTVSSLAAYGDKAVQKAEEDKPDLILMDIVLKGEMDGIEAANQIRSRFNIPIIYLTAYDNNATLERAKITEPFGYMIKPFKERELHTTIEMALFKHKIEIKLKEKSNEIEKINKELGDFVYIVSHDLKEPLFAIEGYAKRLAGKYADKLDEKGKRYINRINANVEIMSKRIYEIMEVMKSGTVKYDFVNNDIRAIINDAVRELESKIKNNRIKLIIQDDLPTVNCDSKRIKNVFLNLASNAIKFIGNDNQKEIKIGCSNGGDCYKFFVEDTGIGIQPEHREHIFKIFTRLKHVEAEGTGVGLAIVKKIVELHKGKVWVESPVKDNRGTRFCFTIPVLGKLE